MKAIMISINPKWCELIVNGQKTIEVRKTRPNIKTPFKCYIYCTKDRKNPLPIEHGKVLDKVDFWKNIDAYYGFGKVIGEFVCDRIDEFSQWEYDYASLLRHIDLYAGTNGDYKFLDDYLKGHKKGYGWHMSDVKIYDKPKELGEFYKSCDIGDKVICSNCEQRFNRFCNGRKYIKRPPQSWLYIEEL